MSIANLSLSIPPEMDQVTVSFEVKVPIDNKFSFNEILPGDSLASFESQGISGGNSSTSTIFTETLWNEVLIKLSFAETLRE